MNKHVNAIQIVIAAALAAVLLCALAFVGCGKDYQGFDDSGMPKSPSDEAVLAKWDEYEILKSVPRYTGGGFFDLIANPSGDAVNVYYNATTKDDYVEYNSVLTRAGFKLESGSSVWSVEDTLGVPQYVKDDIRVTLVWSADGTLAVCAAYK